MDATKNYNHVSPVNLKSAQFAPEVSTTTQDLLPMRASEASMGIRLQRGGFPPKHLQSVVLQEVTPSTPIQYLETSVPTSVPAPVTTQVSTSVLTPVPPVLEPLPLQNTMESLLTAQSDAKSNMKLTKTLPTELKMNLKDKSYLKNNFVYKFFLFVLAMGVVLYITKNYWWKFVVKKFFPSDLKQQQQLQNIQDLQKFSVSKNEYVKELVEADVPMVLGPSPFGKVVLIYATWCKHCEHVMPAFEEAAKVIEESKSKGTVLFMRGEASEAPSLANRPNVPGFPTIVGIFQNGKEFPYHGPRTMDSFVKFAELIASSSTVQETEKVKAPRKVDLKTLINSSTHLHASSSSLPTLQNDKVVSDETNILEIHESSDLQKKLPVAEADTAEKEEEETEEKGEETLDRGMEVAEEDLHTSDGPVVVETPVVKQKKGQSTKQEVQSLEEKRDSETSKKRKPKNLKL